MKSKILYIKPMKTEPVKDVLNSFIDWLPNDAHNCKQVDANIIVSHYQNHDLFHKLKEKVTGFSDTLPLFQPKISNLRSYSQTSLAILKFFYKLTMFIMQKKM